VASRTIKRVRGSGTASRWAGNEDQLGAERERLGAVILRSFEDLVENPELLEGIRLYLGANVDSIRIHSRKLGADHHEEWVIDVLGRLVYELSGPEGGEMLGMPEDCVSMGLVNRRVILGSPRDFRVLCYESVASLHRVVESEDFFIKLAWIMGRCDKPGFSVEGFEEECETWRIMAADPEDLPHLRRGLRKRSGFIGQS